MLRIAAPFASSLAVVACSLVVASCGPAAAPIAQSPADSASASASSGGPGSSAPSTSAASRAPAASGQPGAAAASGANAAASVAGAAAPTTTAPAAPPPAPALPAVLLVPVEPTKIAGKPPVLAVLAPAKNLLIPTAKAAAFEVRVSAKEWKPVPGDHLCVVLDKRPCRRAEADAKPLRLGDLGALDEGQHVLSVLARHASGEFFRPAGKLVPFASVSFFVGKKVAPVHKDGTPMLFYSAPERGPAPGEGVLVDFFVANAEVRSGDVVIHASVGGPGIERGVGLSIDANKPLRLTHARAGEYLSRMTLMQFVPNLGESKSFTTVTYTAKPVPGPFGEIERSIFVTK